MSYLCWGSRSKSIFTLTISFILISFLFQNCRKGFEAIGVEEQASSQLQIVKQPFSKSAYEGTSVTLLAIAKSSDEVFLTYQWYKDNQQLVGQFDEILTITNLQLADAGNYSVEVWANPRPDASTPMAASSKISEVARLVVAPPPAENFSPVLQQQPQSQLVRSGDTESFLATIDAWPVASIQWYKDGEPLIGQNWDYLFFRAVSAQDHGIYYAEVSNSEGLVKTEPFLVSVDQPNLPPQILEISPDQTVGVNQEVLIKVTDVSIEAPTYQWLKDAELLPDQTTNQILIPATDVGDGGIYDVFVRNSFGTQIISTRLTVIAGLTLVQPLEDTMVAEGAPATMTAQFDGQIDSYQWFLDGVLIPDATLSSYSIALAALEDAGTYTVRATNVSGAVETSAVLSVVAPPVIVQGLQDVNLQELVSVSLTVQVSGLGLTYAWFKDNQLIAGATQSALTINQANHLTPGLYRVSATNIAGTVSAEALVSVNLLLDGAQLYDRDCASCHAALDVSMKLDRNFDQIKMAMLTDPMMILQFADNGVALRSDAQIQAIADALEVLPPVIVQEVQAATVAELSNAQLSVQASGRGTITYQWFKNDVAIVGATQSTFDIQEATFLDQALYRVDVTNGAGTVSSAAGLTVSLLLDGPQLYARDCASCHLALAMSTKRNRTFTQIKNSFVNPLFPTMTIKLSVDGVANRTDEQIQAITDALNN